VLLCRASFVQEYIYIINIDYWQEVGKECAEFFQEIRLAATLVEVSCLITPEVLVEIEADAFIIGIEFHFSPDRLLQF
jgi:hypothetical protein